MRRVKQFSINVSFEPVFKAKLCSSSIQKQLFDLFRCFDTFILFFLFPFKHFILLLSQQEEPVWLGVEGAGGREDVLTVSQQLVTSLTDVNAGHFVLNRSWVGTRPPPLPWWESLEPLSHYSRSPDVKALLLTNRLFCSYIWILVV